MPAVKVVTDSAADLSDDVIAELDIAVVPLSIRFGSEEFVDRVTLSPQQFYEKMASTPTLPETAAPSPGAFEKVFRDALDAGAPGVVCINLSGALSATIQSAQNAARAITEVDPGAAPIRIVDSRSVTGGLGSQVVAAARAARDGRSADDIAALVEDMVGRTRVFGALDTLDNLKKGGRIGGAQALLGSLLSIKPRLLKHLDTSAAPFAKFTRLLPLTDDATVRTAATKPSSKVCKRGLEQVCITNIDVFPCCTCGDATGT